MSHRAKKRTPVCETRCTDTEWVSCNALWVSCERGDFDGAAAYAERVGAAGVRANSNRALLFACQSGNKKLVEHLVEAYDLQVLDVRTNDSVMLRRACEYGHLPIAIWLVRRFGLTFADVQAKDFGALSLAVRNGHLAVVAWLVESFKITADNVRLIQWRGVREAYVNGHLATVGWLAGRFGTSAVDPRTYKSRTIRDLCQVGKIDELVWIDKLFGLRKKDLEEVERDNLATAIALGKGLPILQWISMWVDLGSAMYNAPGTNWLDQPLLAAACASGHVDVMAWLLETYPGASDVAGAIAHAGQYATNFGGKYAVDAKAGIEWLQNTTAAKKTTC